MPPPIPHEHLHLGIHTYNGQTHNLKIFLIKFSSYNMFCSMFFSSLNASKIFHTSLSLPSLFSRSKKQETKNKEHEVFLFEQKIKYS